MARWLVGGLLLAVLLSGVPGCGRSTAPAKIDRPVPANRFPKKR